MNPINFKLEEKQKIDSIKAKVNSAISILFWLVIQKFQLGSNTLKINTNLQAKSFSYTCILIPAKVQLNSKFEVLMRYLHGYQ